MIQTIKGYYDNGVVVLEEQPQLKEKVPVYVTFLNELTIEPQKRKRKLGGLEGKLQVPADFDEPLDDLKDYM